MTSQDVAEIIAQVGAFQHIQRERGVKRIADLADLGETLPTRDLAVCTS